MYEDRQHVVHPRYPGYSWHIFYIYSLGTKDTCIVKLNHEHAKVKNRLGPKHSRVLVITFPKYIKTKQKQSHTALSFDIRLNVDMHTYIFSTSRISLDSYATQFMDFKWCLIEWPKARWASTEKKTEVLQFKLGNSSEYVRIHPIATGYMYSLRSVSGNLPIINDWCTEQ